MPFCLWVGSSSRVMMPLLEQGLQPVGENVGGDAFLGLGQQLAKMPPVAEHHVADDEQAPFVAEHFQREIDRAAGAAECRSCSVPDGRVGAL